MESFATPYPLFYSDGDQEVDKGQIGIHSVLQFKRFQAQLSRLIGIPANQLSAVFVCRRTSEKRQKLPINENTNFNIILNQHNPSKEKDCYFLVSQKKSKKERKGSRRRNTEAESVDDDDSTSSRGDASPASQRPGKETDDSFGTYEASSPISVLDQLSTATTPSEDIVKPVTENGNVAMQNSGTSGNVVRPVVENGNVVRQESQQEMASSSPPVTRIGGQLLSRGGGVEQAKFGVIGSGKAPEAPGGVAAGFYPVSEGVVSQARFKDPVVHQHQHQHQHHQQQQQQRMNRMNGVPVFPEGLNMRLLTGRIPQQGLHPGVVHQHFQDVHHHHQQQQLQQQRFNLQARLTRSEGYMRVEQYCPDCASYQERNIRPPPFHCCINDRITTGFNGPSPAGPIERPVKRQVKAAA